MVRSASSNKILDFPPRQQQRYHAAIELYAHGKVVGALAEATALIDEGFPHANTLAGMLYEFGGQGIAQDYKKAAFYYQQAREQVGALEAWLALGRLHYEGKGVPQDYREAFRCYVAVAEDAQDPVAWIMLGRLYREGKGVERDTLRARDYLNKAVAAGYVAALTELALLEQQCGRTWEGWLLRFKAAWETFKLARANPRNPQLRRC
jgi:TPR repeat protein